MSDDALNCEFKDVKELQKSYMQFIKGGGLYLETKKEFNLGDQVQINLKLPETEETLEIPGKVIWVLPQHQQENDDSGVGVQLSFARRVVWVKPKNAEYSQDISADSSGVGIQFTGSDAELVKQKIESLLAKT